MNTVSLIHEISGFQIITRDHTQSIRHQQLACDKNFVSFKLTKAQQKIQQYYMNTCIKDG